MFAQQLIQFVRRKENVGKVQRNVFGPQGNK
jgi:hypothetical protein